MNLLVFAQWRLRVADLEQEIFHDSPNVNLLILLYVFVSDNMMDRKSLLKHFNLDRITMRWHINSLIENELIAANESATDRRQKEYSVTPRGIRLLKDYRNEVIKRTFLYAE